MQFLAKVVCFGLLLGCSLAYAQRGAASKAEGDYNFYSNAGGTSIDHAIDYSYDYQNYVNETPEVNPTIAREQTDAISNSIRRAQKHFGEVRKAATDSDSHATLDTIQSHLNDAANSHAEMIEHVRKNEIDAEGTKAANNRTLESLQKAQAEHQKLMDDSTVKNNQ